MRTMKQGNFLSIDATQPSKCYTKTPVYVEAAETRYVDPEFFLLNVAVFTPSRLHAFTSCPPPRTFTLRLRFVSSLYSLAFSFR
jgi:hypothetical protein